MKFLAFSDVHGSKRLVDALFKKAQREKVDFLICAGDISVFQSELEIILEHLNSLGMPIIIISGNHEDPTTLQSLCKTFENLIYLHESIYEIDDFVLVGYGNSGFLLHDAGFEKFSQKIKKKIKDKKVILITHGPPFGTKLDKLHGDFVGCQSITDFILENDNVVLQVCGHIHENWGATDVLNKAKLHNLGPNGKIFELK